MNGLLEGLAISEVSVKSLEFSGRIDAEYYRPEMLHYERAVEEKMSVKLGGVAKFLIGPFGSSFTTDNYTDDQSFRYIRGKDVKPLRLMDNDNVYMPQSDYERLKRYALKENDILVSVVGTLGNSAIVGKKDLPATFSCKSTVVRPNDIDPKYLTVYLNSRFGYALLVRKERGVIQAGLNLDDLKDLPVFTPSKNFQRHIAASFDKSLHLLSLSKSTQADAESTLLDALGLADWTPPEPLTYAAKASDALVAGRLDAQYFMPAKEQVKRALAALPGMPLSGRVNSIREQWVPDRAPPTMRVRNYDVTDALVPLLDAEKEPSFAADIGSMKKVLRDGDVAVSRLRAYLKEIAVVRTGDAIPSVGSSEFIVLRPKGPGISPETLMVFLRSQPVQTILKWCQDGSQHPRFSESDLLAIPVPDAVAEASAKVTLIVQEGFAARDRARRLLDASKRAVEIAIEESEAAALNYLAMADGAN